MHLRSRPTAAAAAAVLAAAATVLTAGGASAQHIVQVKDINTVTAYSSDSFPTKPVQVGAVAYFTATGTSSNAGLWKTDGTAAGTVLVREFPAGINGATLTAVGGTLYFQATDLGHGAELWKTDGTESGTVLVRDIRPGSASASPANLAEFAGHLYFSANDGTSGIELWSTDGTETGTTLIELAPGTTGSTPSEFRVMGARLYFSAADGVRGQELWTIDQERVPALVRDINAGSLGSGPSNLVVFGGALFFAATEAGTGRELWRSDGTAGGTTLVLDGVPGTGGSGPVLMTVSDGLLFYRGFNPATGSELWKSDGTAAGTGLLKDLVTGSGSSDPTYFAPLSGGRVVFAANVAPNGSELWSSDGTAAGTVLVKDIYVGAPSSTPTELTVIGGAVFFAASDATTLTQLWKTDGTAAGTIRMGLGDGFAPRNFGSLNSLVLFRSGGELWKCDGTVAGTSLVKNINNQRSSSITSATSTPGALYFSANDGAGEGQEPWKSDGTTAGTFRLKDICVTPDLSALCGEGGGSTPAGFTAFGGNVFFAATDSVNGREFWKTNGTPAGTQLVGNINFSTNSSNPTDFVSYAGSLFFVATSTFSGRELFRSNGTTEGTVFFADINPGAASSSPSSLKYINGQVFFQATTAANGTELWVLDGTLVPTLVKDIGPGTASSSPTSLTGVPRADIGGEEVYFAADNGTSGVELWKSDGFGPRTVMVADANPGAASSFPSLLTAVGTAVFYRATDATGSELWRSDGTAPGTARVKDIRPGPNSSAPASLTAAGNVLFFVANDGVHGAELWKSDGTDAGTVLVMDIVPGDGSPGITSMVATGEVVLFSADDGISGRELWVSDGTEEGTHLVEEVGPDSISAGVSDITSAVGRVFFRANDGVTGNELWAFANIAPTARAGADRSVPLGTAVLLDGGASTDPEGDLLTYEWRNFMDVKVGTGPTLDVTPPLGSHEFRLIARDGYGGMATDAVRVTVTGTPQLDVTLSGTGGGHGTVAVNPPGAVCENASTPLQTCTYLQTGFSTVTLTATAGPGSVFVGWTGACSGSGPCQVFMSQDVSVTALFDGQQTLTVTVDSVENGSGFVHVSPPETPCAGMPGAPQTCTYVYPPYTLVSLYVMPNSDSVFIGWAGACSGMVQPCQVTLDEAKNVIALFRGPQPLSVNVDSVENGSGLVFASPRDTTCAGTPGTLQTCTYLYTPFTLVSLYVMPNSDSVFIGWAGACSGMTQPCQVTMDQAKNVIALFRGPQPLSVTVESVENGSGFVFASPRETTCAGTPGTLQTCTYLYTPYTLVSLYVMPNSDSVFIGWAGACSGMTQPCQVTMDQAKTVIALFRGPQPLSVTVDSIENGSGLVFASPRETTCAGTPGMLQTCTYLYTPYTLVSLYVMPTSDSVFIGWAGACSGLTQPCQVTMDQAKNVIALFRGPQPLSLTVDSIEGGVGIVSLSPPDTTCATTPGTLNTCTHLYTPFTLVSLSAMPAPGSAFVSWGGACIGTAPTCQVTMDQAKNVIAQFRGPQALNLSVVGRQGVVRVTPPSALCTLSEGSTSVNCNYQMAPGETVLLEPLPPPNTIFVGWAGPDCTGTGPCTVVMSQLRSVTAIFRGPSTLLLEVTGTEGGSGAVTVTPPSETCANAPGASQSCSYPYLPDTPVQLVAVAAADSTFAGWNAPCVGTGPCLLTMDGTRMVTARFHINHAPVAQAGGPYSAVRGAAVSFDGSGSSDQDGDSLAYAWDFGDGATGTGVSPSHAYAATGSFTVTLTVSDGRLAGAPATATVTIANRAPDASVGGPYSGTHGRSVSFDASASTDADGDALTFSWTFGDGGTATGATPSHVYAVDGDYPVTVSVSDGQDTTSASTVAHIANVPPLAIVGGPYSGFKNAPFVLDGTASTDGNSDGLTYLWDFGDGSAPGAGVTPSHTYGLPPGVATHVYTATLVVSDGFTSSAPATTSVEVRDHAPVANAGSGYSAFRGAPVAFDGSGSLDEDGDALTYLWNFGDGATGTGRNPTHAYASFGTFGVTLTVHDGYASSVPSHASVTITDRAPTAVAGGPYSGFRGVAVTFSGAGSSDPDGNGLTYAWDFGDGGTGTGIAPTHVYATLGTFTARLVVSDGATSSAPAFATVTIANRAPTARPGGPYTGLRGVAVAFNGSTSSDPDGDPLAYAWNFGDGTTGTGATPSHVYTTLGTKTVTLVVSDGFTSSPPVTTTVTVTNRPPIANAGADRTVVRRTTVTLDGRASSDPDGTITAYAWRQLSGPTVTLQSAATAQPRFTAPNVSSTTTMSFELKVTDNNGATAIDTVVITVTR